MNARRQNRRGSRRWLQRGVRCAPFVICYENGKVIRRAMGLAASEGQSALNLTALQIFPPRCRREATKLRLVLRGHPGALLCDVITPKRGRAFVRDKSIEWMDYR